MATTDFLQSFDDPAIARQLLRTIGLLAERIGRDVRIMEVCGTHTMEIARCGLRSVLPPSVHLVSGPGCPVCVTSQHDIDEIIALARVGGVTLATFGDMMRVPGTAGSLQDLKAEGAHVEVVYSPLDALELARKNPQQQVVFAGIGFETTAPATAIALQRAREAGLSNFSLYCAHKTVPPVLEVLAEDEDLRIDALMLPGHVSTIIGSQPYGFLPEDHGLPGVITGFAPVDLLQGIAMILRQIDERAPRIEIAYARGVQPEGNPTARAAIDSVFEPADADWRGFGCIPDSGLAIRTPFGDLDAMRRFDLHVEAAGEPVGCRCADVLRGIIAPDGCALFGNTCSPEHPVGPCMVSSEGSCAAFHRYAPLRRGSSDG